MTRLRLALATCLACAAAAVIGLVAARAGNGGSTAALEASPTGFAGFVRPPGIPPARFALRDADGRLVTARSLRGAPVVVTFIYSHCKDTCPLTVQQIRGGLDDLGRDVPVLGVSVDPRNDTPESARAFVAKEHMTGRIRFLLGTRVQLRPVWRQFGVQPQSVDHEHSADTVVLDPRGVQRVGYQVDELTPEGLAHDLRRLGAGASGAPRRR